MIVVFLICAPPNPFVPDNSKVYLVIQDTKGLIDISQPVTETVMDSIWVGVYAYLNS
jgi:hypothetical protein